MCENSNNAISTWPALIEQLQKRKEFRVHTGDINNYVELKLKRFVNSADELAACLDLQFKNLPTDTQIWEDGTLYLADGNHKKVDYERDDVKITLKLFINTFDFGDVCNAIDVTLKELDIGSIEQLIIAFPQADEENQDINTEFGGTLKNLLESKWIQNIIELYTKIETLVAIGKVLSIGVGDLHLKPLKAIYENVKIKPCLDHFNIEGCCVVPPELQSYAKDNNIQLLTHNDPHPFPVKKVFRVFCEPKDYGNESCQIFDPTWAARYTIWVRRRSLIAAKGFIVQFVRS